MIQIFDPISDFSKETHPLLLFFFFFASLAYAFHSLDPAVRNIERAQQLQLSLKIWARYTE